MFTDLKQWDNAYKWAKKSQSKGGGKIKELEFENDLLKKQADWMKENNDHKQAGKLYMQAKDYKRAVRR